MRSMWRNQGLLLKELSRSIKIKGLWNHLSDRGVKKRAKLKVMPLRKHLLAIIAEDKKLSLLILRWRNLLLNCHLLFRKKLRKLLRKNLPNLRQGWEVRRRKILGKRIVLSEMSHMSRREMWSHLSLRKKMFLKWLPATDPWRSKRRVRSRWVQVRDCLKLDQ